MKIGASTLAGIDDSLENALEFIEGLGIDYAEIVHQFPTEHINPETLESYSLKYTAGPKPSEFNRAGEIIY